MAVRERHRQEQPTDTRLAWLLAALVVLRLALAHAVPVAEDETYYWLWSRHLALAYFDHPPMIAWLVAAGGALLGDSVLALRLFPALLSVATVGLVYAITRTCGGDRADGWWAALAASVLPLFAAGLWLATPDAPLSFFWAAGLWCACLAWRHGQTWRWALAGLVVGLALISKYTAVLLPASLLAALVAMPAGRRALRGGGPYAAIACACVPTLPVLVATLGRAGDGVAFQLAHGFGAGEVLRPWATFAEFVGGQLGVVTPLLLALLLIALAGAARAAAPALGASSPASPGAAGRAHAPALRALLVFPALGTLGLFALASLFGDPEANWAAPAYLSACVLLGPRLRVMWSRAGGARAFAGAALGLALLVSSLLLVDAVHPLIPARKSPAVAVRDRSALVAWLQAQRERESEPVALLFSTHRLASFFAFSLTGHPPTGVPLARGSGSQFHRWRSPACDTREAWYITDDALKPYYRVMRTVRHRARFNEYRLGRHVGTVMVYRGDTVPGLCDAGAVPDGVDQR